MGADDEVRAVVKVGVLGLWHLGCVTAACVAAAGLPTVGVDDDAQVIAALSRGDPPLFEPHLSNLVQHGMSRGLLSFTTDPAVLAAMDVVWICYDTPVDDEDRADVGFVLERVRAIFPHLGDGAIVLLSAQLPVGTVAELERAFAPTAAGRRVEFACSPENLRLGSAIDAFQHPPRIVVGTRSARCRQVLGHLLGHFCNNLIFTSVESAEMAKHALNAFLAVSVTFANELAVICEQVGANAAEVEAALRSDPRVGARAYVRPGPAFSGGTLARDIRFLSLLADRHRVPGPLIASVLPSNAAHGGWMLDRLRAHLGSLAGRRVSVLGLAYKAGTDAIRRSAAIELIRALIMAGAEVRAFDPAVQGLPEDLVRKVEMLQDARGAIAGAEAVAVATEWPQFRELTAEDFAASMSGNLILDPGRFLDPAVGADPRLRLVSVGRPATAAST
jgi:UDPglucose 6-dehydrogenase